MMIKRIKYGAIFFLIMCANCYVQHVAMTKEFIVQQEKQDITSSDKSGKSVHNSVGYTKIHIRHNILISGKLQYPATPFPRRCWIKQFSLYSRTSIYRFSRGWRKQTMNAGKRLIRETTFF